MFCQNCGAEVSENTRFCKSCGAEITENAPIAAAPNAPAYGYTPLSMKWYKLLIYFSLFASAVIHFSFGYLYITGNIYDGDLTKMYLYYSYEGLDTVDMLLGIGLIALAVFAVFVRIWLSRFKHNSPSFLNMLFGFSAALSILHLFGALLVGADVDDVKLGHIFLNIILSSVMVFVNSAYFKKRAHLFVK